MHRSLCCGCLQTSICFTFQQSVWKHPRHAGQRSSSQTQLMEERWAVHAQALPCFSWSWQQWHFIYPQAFSNSVFGGGHSAKLQLGWKMVGWAPECRPSMPLWHCCYSRAQGSRLRHYISEQTHSPKTHVWYEWSWKKEEVNMDYFIAKLFMKHILFVCNVLN